MGISENDRKNEGKQFSSNYQPTGEAKSKGWERKRLAREFMDKVFQMQNLSIKEFEEVEKEIFESKEKYTMQDLMVMNYIRKMINSEKLILDWLDRHIGKPQKFEEDKNENKIDKVVVEIINAHEKFPDEEII